MSCGELNVRTQNVYNWLRMLKQCNPKYWNITINESDECKLKLQNLTKELLDNIEIVDNVNSINIERVVTSDTAEVRRMKVDEIVNNSAELKEENNSKSKLIPIGNTMIFNNNERTEKLLNDKVINGICDTFLPKLIHVNRSPEPINEFENNSYIYLGLFPNLFLFGTFGNGVKINGTLPKKYVRHLLYQRSCKFAEDSKFIFTTFNQQQRHETASVVNIKAKNDPNLLVKLGATLLCPQFKNKLEIAQKDPMSKEAKEILKTIDPLLRITGNKVHGSPDERKSAITTLISMIQFYGNPSIFFTFAPDDIHSLLTLRMCCPTKKGNCKFPSVDDGFEEYMRQKNCKGKFKNILDDSIDISEVNLHYLLSKNPVAAAEIFKITLETIFEILFGIKPEHYNKVTIPNSSHNKGIFGNTRAAFTVTEIQGRLSLHGHMTVWTSLSPSIIQRSIKCKKLLESVKDVIKSQIASTIPLNYHITSMSRQATTPEERPTDEPRRTYYDSPSPDLNLAGFEDHVHRVVNSTSVHQHSPQPAPHGAVDGPPEGVEGSRRAVGRDEALGW